MLYLRCSRILVAITLYSSTRIKPVSFDVLRLRMQRVINENQTYKAIYRNQLSLIPAKSDSAKEDSYSLDDGPKKHQSTEKWRKKIHRLQQRLQQSEAELLSYREECSRIHFENRSLRKQLIKQSVIPTIQTKAVYLTSIQQHELELLNRFFSLNRFAVCESPSDSFSHFLSEKLNIPRILHLSILRQYSLFIHYCSPKPNKIHSSSSRNKHDHQLIPETCQRSILYLPPSELERGWNICVVECQSFIDFWMRSMMGYDERERLFQSLCDGDEISYFSIKQMVCDFLYWNQEVRSAIHGNENQNAEELSICCHYCIYITTVSVAVLFNLTGLTSLSISKRDVLHSNLFSILQLLDKKSSTVILPFAPAYSQQIFNRFESLCLGFDHTLLPRSCIPCDSVSPDSHHSLSIPFDTLIDSMTPKLTPLCLQRAIRRINMLIECTSDNSLSYEAYAMFNILYNVEV